MILYRKYIGIKKKTENNNKKRSHNSKQFDVPGGLGGGGGAPLRGPPAPIQAANSKWSPSEMVSHGLRVSIPRLRNPRSSPNLSSQ